MIKTICTSLIVIICSFVLSITVTFAATPIPGGVDPNIQRDVGPIVPPTQVDSSPNAVNNYVLTAVNVLLLIGLVLVLVYILYGGLKWIMAGGDAKLVQGAQGTITHAIIGLILLALSFAVSTVFKNLVGGTVGGTTITDPYQYVGSFCSPQYPCQNPAHSCVSGSTPGYSFCECLDPQRCNRGAR
jgi:hypothetical protein